MTKAPQQTQFFESIRYALNSDGQSIPNVNELNWNGLYQFANEQAIVGVLFEGVKRLSEQGVKPPFDVLMQWIATAERIEGQNQKLNQECQRLTQLFESEGHKTAILKGQANARLYTKSLCRQPGDIDIYVDGGEQRVLNTLLRLKMIDKADIGEYEGVGNASKSYHHVHLTTNERGVDVEIHFRPSSGVWNPIANKKLQRFLEAEIGSGCKKVDEGFRVPSLRFALVMQMAHIENHLMDEGIGLRQIMDYYYLLKSDERQMVGDLSELFQFFGLDKIAGAVMWILREILGLEEKLLIVPVDEWRGKFLLREIIKGGNFGKYSVERRQNGLGRLILGRKKHLRLLRFDFKETIWYELKYWKMQIEKTVLRVRRRSWTVR